MISGSKRTSRIRARIKTQEAEKAVIATRAVAYLRVSTDEQAANGFGLETQERALRAFAESQAYELVELVTDAGISGATKPNERPGFSRVFELAEAKAFSILLVYKFDRLAREIRYAVIRALPSPFARFKEYRSGQGGAPAGSTAAPASGTPAPAPVAKGAERVQLPGGYTAARALSDAKAAVAGGKDKAVIAERLRAYGIDPKRLDD